MNSVNNFSDGEFLFNLARRFNKGDKEIVKNHEIATNLFQIAADQGHVRTLVKLGHRYQKGGCGITRNLKTAIELYQKAAALGDASAKHILEHIIGMA